MEVLTDYDFTIHYHPEKANKVADALSQESIGTLDEIDFELVIVCGVLRSVQMCPVILDEIRKA